MSVKTRRVLFVATVVKRHIMVFHIPCLKMFKQLGYETVVVAKNDYDNPEDCQIPYCDRYIEIPFEREPFCRANVQCYKKLKSIIEEGDFDIIHCHTPVGGVLTRLAARNARKKGTRVLYTAHGLHFYRGAPLLNWLIYYPVEAACAGLADAVLTINEEDWLLAKKHFQKTKVFYLPGIGVNVEKYAQSNHGEMDFGIGNDQKRILSVGELNDNKNHKIIIKALTLPQLENVHYLIAGEGHRRTQLEEYAASLQVSDRVHFLGFRSDIDALLHAVDLFVFPSQREGLPVAVMEAMAAGLPVVISRIRGNVDLIKDGDNGFLCDPKNAEDFANKIRMLLDNPDLAKEFSDKSKEKIKEYEESIILGRLREIYCDVGAHVDVAQENC